MVRIGTLEYLPAINHPELLAAAVHAALTDDEYPGAHVAAINPDLADTADFLAAYQTPATSSANCVLVIGKRGNSQMPAACLAPSNLRVDVNVRVRKLLDARKASFAPHDWAVNETGMEYGGITPIGVPPEWKIFVDQRVALEDWVIIGSGLRRSKIAIPGPQIAALPGTQVIEGLAV